jgi:hypothetical protein
MCVGCVCLTCRLPLFLLPSKARDDFLQLCHSGSYSVCACLQTRVDDGNMKYLQKFYGKPISERKLKVEIEVQY